MKQAIFGSLALLALCASAPAMMAQEAPQAAPGKPAPTVAPQPAEPRQEEAPPAESPIISGMRIMMNAKAEEVDARATPVGQQRFGGLRAGASATLTVELDPAKAHLIVAACDFDCVAIDLKAFDEADTLVAEHRGGGDLPTLRIPPNKAHTLRVTLTMTECREDVCRAGIGVYQRSRP
jgi:hypothetical protein